MAPFLHCFRCGIFIDVPWQPRRYLRLVPQSGSVPPSGCFSVQAKPTLSCVMKSGIPSSPPLALPTSPEAAHQFCPTRFTAVLLEPPGTRQHRPLSSVACFLPGIHFVRCRQARPTAAPPPPLPNLAVILFAFDRSICGGYFQQLNFKA